jgi:hypothetical protein
MNIRNYTSSVSADKSVLMIEKVLIEMGATNIAKEYQNGRVFAISFAIRNGDGMLPFRLPGKVEPIKKLFVSTFRRPTSTQIKSCGEQAERTAWKNVYEWVAIQATMIKLEQAEITEVFFPYLYNMNTGKTLFENAKENNYKGLLSDGRN